jgi:hypothetical protein
VRQDGFQFSSNSTTHRNQKHYLIRASLKAFPLLFIAPIPPRILLVLAVYMQPLLASRMITFVGDPDQSSARGWSLVGGFVLAYGLIFLMTSIYWEKVVSPGIMVMVACVKSQICRSLNVPCAIVPRWLAISTTRLFGSRPPPDGRLGVGWPVHTCAFTFSHNVAADVIPLPGLLM